MPGTVAESETLIQVADASVRSLLRWLFAVSVAGPMLVIQGQFLVRQQIYPREVEST